MKILPIEQVHLADAYTIENEPIADIDLMERAAKICFESIIMNTSKDKPIKIFCGMGNNGGDGFAIARMLALEKYNVEIILILFTDKMSPSCKINYERILKIREVKVTRIKESDKIPDINKSELVIDAIFGSGLTRPILGFIGDVIDFINTSEAIVIAIDVPSGLFCDKTNETNQGSIIKADYTYTFKPPKLAFLFPENDSFVGRWKMLDIGLFEDFIDSVKVDNYLIDIGFCKNILKKRNVYDHKGIYGHALLISGSYGKIGAAVLASEACLRAGAGLVTTHIPKCGYNIVQSAIPEAMTSIDNNENYLSELPDLSTYNTIAIGPGIGKNELTQKALKFLVQNSTVPIIFDADAINILSENKTWISFIPKNSIFTPHPKEFERLIGKSSDNFERNQKQREFSIKYHVYVILKGAHTAITCPDGMCFFNPTGNPGMATGGSGDVLTGILLGLAAQYYNPEETCILGVYLHGLAGDLAAENLGYNALIAGDITRNLYRAFRMLND